MARSNSRQAGNASLEVVTALRDVIGPRAVYDALRDLGLIYKPGPRSAKPKETLALKMVRAMLDAIDGGKCTARVTAAARLQAMIERVATPDGDFAGDESEYVDDPRNVSDIEAAIQTRATLIRDDPPVEPPDAGARVG